MHPPYQFVPSISITFPEFPSSIRSITCIPSIPWEMNQLLQSVLLCHTLSIHSHAADVCMNLKQSVSQCASQSVREWQGTASINKPSMAGMLQGWERKTVKKESYVKLTRSSSFLTPQLWNFRDNRPRVWRELSRGDGLVKGMRGEACLNLRLPKRSGSVRHFKPLIFVHKFC